MLLLWLSRTRCNGQEMRSIMKREVQCFTHIAHGSPSNSKRRRPDESRKETHSEKSMDILVNSAVFSQRSSSTDICVDCRELQSNEHSRREYIYADISHRKCIEQHRSRTNRESPNIWEFRQRRPEHRPNAVPDDEDCKTDQTGCDGDIEVFGDGIGIGPGDAGGVDRGTDVDGESE